MLASASSATATFKLPYNSGTGAARDSDKPGAARDSDKPGTAGQKAGESAKGTGTQNLTEDQLKQLEGLRKRDKEVRAHEAAHQAAAGGLARGGATFSYQRGPDGQLYAIGGEVNIDTSPVSGNPEATLRKAQTIAAAALAPAEPSGQDRQVAAQAARLAAQAQAELSASQSQESGEDRQRPSDRFKAVEASDREPAARIDLYA
jgi:hypothetical protein